MRSINPKEIAGENTILEKSEIKKIMNQSLDRFKKEIGYHISGENFCHIRLKSNKDYKDAQEIFDKMSETRHKYFPEE